MKPVFPRALPAALRASAYFGDRDRLRVAAAILDGICLSGLLWLAILAVLR